ncbi:Eco57I restriction-modification methylase domain-containing protein [Bifidobacterium stellenboschense]|uniref:site-specific DNA-methyltransferase (adenine-specific) n=1 Tax=Bifidobacterium stellenboschense TaxID=762211 RepID=A0A087DND7_9BIFI|nr:Eco57I restriction-modification methylase domain-containing protein [Bifidobacterium stellenboschense]KFI97037.1 Modification methylase [Bifidobacterium stellenboschense]
MTSKTIAQIRNEAAASLSPKRQQQWEQFLTPMPVAEQAVGLFTPTDDPVRILDLGSGSGILSAVTASRSASGSSVVAIEQDTELARASESSLRQVCDDVEVINKSVFDVLLDARFDRVILNPPYKKISPTVISTSGGGVKVTNLYTAFLVMAIQAMDDGGECVAIIPRSWMNGDYFKDFRKWMLNECSLDVLAVYGSRHEHFKDMNILQEIMLVKMSKRQQAEKVTVYAEASPVEPLEDQPHESVALKALLMGRDRIVRVRQQDPRLSGFKTMADQGLWVSTGKLVWFRNRDVLSDVEDPNGHPLYWSDNQNGMMTLHPVECDREQWVTEKADTRNIVLPAGSYCLVNRFSAKEQQRRIHASYLHSGVEFVADNKLNYVHQGTSRHTVPLDDRVARGLTLWLSSSIVDEWYRQVSGSTQVNATDLRQLPCPSKAQLAVLADSLPVDNDVSQSRIDETIGRLFSWVQAS